MKEVIEYKEEVCKALQKHSCTLPGFGVDKELFFKKNNRFKRTSVKAECIQS